MKMVEMTPIGLNHTPFLNTVPRGLFATRAPKRPNPIGVTTVLPDPSDGGMHHIRDVGMPNGTLLLDIKPHVPEFDNPLIVPAGRLEKARKPAGQQKSDNRFK